MSAPEPAEYEALPAWSLPADAVERIAIPVDWPERVTRDWAWGGSDGSGARVCILDSGVETDHPLVGDVEESVAVTVGEDGEVDVVPDEEGDLCGHGTACAGIVRSLAPGCSISSVRVLGAGYTGSGPVLVAGLRWAIERGFDVINMSLSTTKRQLASELHDLADVAYFRRTMLVASAHNMPVESFPWRFASVVSVGSHEQSEPLAFFYNPTPPVNLARGVDVDAPWLGGGRLRVSGNSFATPHMAGICASSSAPRADPVPAQERPHLVADNVAAAR